MWCAYRKTLEEKWIDYVVVEKEKTIWRNTTAIIAFKHLDIIFKCMKTDDPKKAMMQRIKFTEEQAEYVLGRILGSLSKTNIHALEENIIKTKKEVKELGGKKKDLTNTIVTQFDSYITNIK